MTQHLWFPRRILFSVW